MIDLKITVGGKEILYSGTVTSTNNADVCFEVAERIKVRLKFESEDDSSQRLRAEVENNELIFTLINFNNSLGTEFTEPLEIGTYQGRTLYLHLRVYAINSSNRVINHTWYLDDVVNNG